MEVNRREEGRDPQIENPSGPNNNQSKVYKGKSCKGCLYYSSVLNSKSRSPTCVGIPRTLPQVPNYIVGETKSEASKEGRNLADFKYACVGYSIYLENKDSLTDQKNRPAELPFCVGVEVLLDKRPSTAGHVPAHVHKSGDGATVPEHRPTTHSTGEDFLSRFKRSAGLVASGVVRNANRVGNHIKQSLDDMLFRRPK
ncbi:hypothetical protein HS088_TW07G00999 [Tripterygium wilfordii]|uniref:DUF8204 domain-containing protein n=1 Tax=Tripterygium wilfordii TaxID=458696 RepID=A0A7J7DGA5_TRIWF|nr:uncharacterized protein LOC120002743 isoform X1 [Tripterygium wilfordii]KAF5745415.1 hypothetical protein HS088_TW07G00999 [Tripterygium wilfordii]